MSEKSEQGVDELNRYVEDASAKVRDSTNLGEVLLEESRRLKRAVLALSIIGYIVGQYHVDLTTIPWLSIAVPEDARSLGAWLNLIALLYHMVGFGLHAWADVKSWIAKQENSRWKGIRDVLFKMNSQVHELGQIIQLIDNGPQSDKVPDLVKTRNDAVDVIKSAIGQFHRLAGTTAAVYRRKRFTAWAWDFWLPLIVGTLSCGVLIGRLCTG
jgi:hypothetical protein